MTETKAAAPTTEELAAWVTSGVDAWAKVLSAATLDGWDTTWRPVADRLLSLSREVEQLR